MKSRSINFSLDFLSDFSEWARVAPKLVIKISDLLEECAKTPFEGKGKPEPLRGDLKGFWSRRINDEHRLIYRVDDNYVYAISCKGHYE